MHRNFAPRPEPAQKFIDFRHGGLIGDQFVDVATEVLRQHTIDENLALATLVDDFVAAKAQGVQSAVGETMIVLMATGNTPVMEMNLFEGLRTLAANVAWKA